MWQLENSNVTHFKLPLVVAGLDQCASRGVNTCIQVQVQNPWTTVDSEQGRKEP